MKKIALFGLLALGLGFAACDEVQKADAQPQTNPEEPTMVSDDIAVATAEATKTEVSLAQYDEAGVVPVLDITKLENFPEGYTLGGIMRIADNEEMTNAQEIALQREENVLNVAVEDWETAHIALYTKNPREVTSWVDFTLVAINGTAEVRLGDANICKHEIKVTPLPAKNIVESSYVLLVDNGTVNMSATNPDNVYDPPTFFGSFEVPTGASVKWGVKAGETGATFTPVPSDGNPLVGTLVAGEAQTAFAEQGPWLVTVDMEKLTYTIAQAIPQLYAYFQQPNKGMELTTGDFVHYNGFLCGRASQVNFKFANSNNNPDMIWGTNDDGDVQLGGKGFIKLEEGGANYLKINLTELTVEAVNCAQFSLIGFWDGWTTDTELTHNNLFDTWTGEITITEAQLAAAGDSPVFKIRTNDNWDGINLGGVYGDETNLNTLVEHGENLIWTSGAGTFKLTLSLAHVPYTLTVEKK